MTRKPLHLMLPSLLFVLPMAYYTGGWATITVDDLPDYVVAGEPVRLSYTVRQHGLTRIDLLSGFVEAKGSAGETRVSSSGLGSGRYAATLTPPRPGEWTITIRSGFGKGKTTLAPMTAVARGTRPVVAMAEHERGRRLFVAKGCVSCHVHREANTSSEVAMGPELTERRYPADYLSGFLADPRTAAPGNPNAAKMPKLDLSQREIASLVTFINANRSLSKR